MSYSISAALGLFLLTVLVWIAHRLKTWQRGADRDKLRSDERAMNEAELLTRSKGPFI